MKLPDPEELKSLRKEHDNELVLYLLEEIKEAMLFGENSFVIRDKLSPEARLLLILKMKMAGWSGRLHDAWFWQLHRYTLTWSADEDFQS